MGLNEIRAGKEAARSPKVKKVYTIPKKSKKKIATEAAERKINTGSFEDWFIARRKEMTGTCQCGCGERSSKKDDTYYRNSLAHIFPKRTFESIARHPLNWVERAFWGGCHSVMDDTSVDRWPGMADWSDIVAKFHILDPLISDREKATKFYSKLKQLIHEKGGH